MSGTSADGVDVVLADFASGEPRVVGFHTEDFPAPLRTELLALNVASANELERSQLAANQLADLYAAATNTLLVHCAVAANDIIAIGCHGQTVRHRPDLRFTLQLNNPARLTERTGITVVADFRARDIAAGGQGAPMVPAFHDGVFRAPDATRVVVNIGGIANITILEKHRPAWGFDTGPGNCLMDAWIHQHQRLRFDDRGAWAAQGQALARLSGQLQGDSYFQMPPPKSTGRDQFNLHWLTEHLSYDERAVDVQATLLNLTAQSIANDIHRHAQGCTEILVCGGGAQNITLLARLAEYLPEATIAPTDKHGVPAQQVEALAFAWFAKQCIERRAVDLTATTGAAHANVLGAIYPK